MYSFIHIPLSGLISESLFTWRNSTLSLTSTSFFWSKKEDYEQIIETALALGGTAIINLPWIENIIDWKFIWPPKSHKRAAELIILPGDDVADRDLDCSSPSHTGLDKLS